jgi:hypothetical protein
MLARSFIALSALALAAVLASGCAAENVDSEPEGESSDAIIGGDSTYFYPAVGVTVNGSSTGCSATLVAPDVILLAAHCFDAVRTTITPWQFEIRKSATQTFRYPTGRGWVLDRGGAGEDDVALLRLETPVPSSVARPLALAREYPASGNKMRMIGFGCTARGGGGAGTKRMISFAWGENKDASCPGDSGGALVAYPSSQIVGVTSGYNTGNGDDLFGWVPKHYDKLTREIAALRR